MCSEVDKKYIRKAKMDYDNKNVCNIALNAYSNKCNVELYRLLPVCPDMLVECSQPRVFSPHDEEVKTVECCPSHQEAVVYPPVEQHKMNFVAFLIIKSYAGPHQKCTKIVQLIFIIVYIHRL